MKKAQREIYLILSNEVGLQICGFCKYSCYTGSPCEDGYCECEHPLHDRVGFSWNDEEPEPGQDCWGFRSMHTVEDAADIVGIVLANEFGEWFFRKFADGTIKVYGRKFEFDAVDKVALDYLKGSL